MMPQDVEPKQAEPGRERFSQVQTAFCDAALTCPIHRRLRKLG
jgi:hypothetical protein